MANSCQSPREYTEQILHISNDANEGISLLFSRLTEEYILKYCYNLFKNGCHLIYRTYVYLLDIIIKLINQINIFILYSFYFTLTKIVLRFEIFIANNKKNEKSSLLHLLYNDNNNNNNKM